MGRRPVTKSEEVFTPTSDKFLSGKPDSTEPSAPPLAQSPELELDAPERDEDAHLGAPEDYMWGLASG